MSTAFHPKLLLAVTAALVAVPGASSLLISDQHNARVARQSFGRPSFTQLEANRSTFSELDKLKAKRLSIRRRIPEPSVELVGEDQAVHVADGNSPPTIGLEYLYEAGEMRHSDDLSHIILMPS